MILGIVIHFEFAISNVTVPMDFYITNALAAASASGWHIYFRSRSRIFIIMDISTASRPETMRF